MLAFQLVRVLWGLDLGLTKVCMSERTEMELDAELAGRTEIELAEEPGFELGEETEMELVGRTEMTKAKMLGLASELQLDAELAGETEMELVGDWVEETGM